MGTVPKDTYAILIKEFDLPIKLEDLEEEIHRELLVAMKSATLMPGRLNNLQ